MFRLVQQVLKHLSLIGTKKKVDSGKKEMCLNRKLKQAFILST